MDHCNKPENNEEELLGPFQQGMEYEGMLDYYEKWTTYETDACLDVYKGPIFVADALANQIPLESRASCRILDVGAGTGFVAMQLKEKGFTDMDALEPCGPMLVEARKRGLYNKYYECGIGLDPVKISDDSYDTIISSGTFGENHIPYKALGDMIRIVKPGGLIVFVIRHRFIKDTPQYADRLQPYMAKLESVGAWKLLKHEIRPHYVADADGSVFTYTVNISGTVDVDV